MLLGALTLTTLSAYTTADGSAGALDECSIQKDPPPEGLNSLANDWVSWVPDVAHPVFWGYEDVGMADGAPGDIRIYYPSLRAFPQDAAIAKQCAAPYPVVLFLHGQPPPGQSDNLYHQQFDLLGRSLARSGYVVVAPSHRATLPTLENAPEMVADVMSDLAWVRQHWDKAEWLDPHAAAVAGHSYGALLAARVAAAHPEMRALVSLSGGFRNLSDSSAALAAVAVPSFFTFADGEGHLLLHEDLDSHPQLWEPLTQPKYAAPYKGEHFDYLRNLTSTEVGPCYPQIGWALADLATLFIAANLPISPNNTAVPVDLTKPEVWLSPLQELYAHAHLEMITVIETQPNCDIDMRWNINGERGERPIGP